MNKSNELKREIFVDADLRVRETTEGEPESRTIEGYAVLFNVLSQPLWDDEDSTAREIISPEAITQELLDSSDIKLTMFHDRQLVLGRSNKGSGTLSYSIDEKGVKFECEVARTADGDKALELVRRGDIAGCSFAFTTRYWDNDFVSRTAQVVDGRTEITYRVDVITGIYDFTLALDPAYQETTVDIRSREQSVCDEGRDQIGRRVAREMRSKLSEINL